MLQKQQQEKEEVNKQSMPAPKPAAKGKPMTASGKIDKGRVLL